MNLYKLEAFIKTNVTNQKELVQITKLLERIKEDLTFSRNIEKNLRIQFTKAQDRNITLQRDLNAFKSATETIWEQQQILKTQDKAICEIKQVIDNLKLLINEKISSVTNEVQLAMQVTELKKKLCDSDAQSSLLRIDHQMALKNKEKENYQLDLKLEAATRGLEKANLDRDMLKNELDRIHLSYSQKIMDLENTIRQYAHERQLVLGVVEGKPPIKCGLSNSSEIWDKNVNITWADATRKGSTGAITKCEDIATTVNNAEQYRIQNNSIEVEKKRSSGAFRPKAKSSLLSAAVQPIVSAKIPPPLDVIVTKESTPLKPKMKKMRLYSSNNNIFDL